MRGDYKIPSQYSTSRSRHGQSLMELLIGMALGALFIIGSAVIIVPSLQTNKQVASVQIQAQLADELLNNVKSWGTGNWNNLSALATGTANPYYLNTSSSPFTIGSPATTSTATIAFVQSTSTPNYLGVSSPSLTFPANTTAGDAIIVGGEWGNTAGAVSCSDNKGDTFVAPASLDIFDPTSGAVQGMALCYALNIAGGATTVTVTLPTNSYTAMSIQEYSGIATSSALDVSSVNNTTTVITASNDATSNASTTTKNGDLIFGGFTLSNGSASGISAGTGFIMRENDFSGAGMATEDQIQSTAGSIAGTWSLGTTGVEYVALMGAFKPQVTTVGGGNATGTQSIVVGSSTYTRYFYISDVYRDSSGNVTSTASGNSYDPSTKEITAVVNVASSTAPPTTYSIYITRNIDNTFSQSSWAGGGGYSSPTTFVSSTFATSTDVTINGQGAIELTGGAGNSCVY